MLGFEDIYIKYFKDVYRYVFSLCRNETLAEDITQETFFKALKGIEDFDGKCKVQVWLCQIAKNTYYSHYEKQKRKSAHENDPVSAAPAEIEQELINRQDAFEIHKALHNMEEPYKEVFSLRLFGELPFSIIAELFGKTESWARVTYYRAKLKIKEKLQ